MEWKLSSYAYFFVMIWKDSIGKGTLVSTAKAVSKRTRNPICKYVVPIVIVKLGISFKKKFRLYNTQSVTYLMNSNKWRILVSGEQHSFICYCIFQKLCIFDSFGTLVFAVFMGVWGKFFSIFFFSLLLHLNIKKISLRSHKHLI